MAQAQDNTKVVSILAYFLVGIIWYFADEKVQNAMTKHHVKQALNYMIISFVISMIFSIVFTSLLFPMIFSGGWMFLSTIMSLVHLALFVFWVFGLIFAINQEKKEIPLIGQFAEKYLTF